MSAPTVPSQSNATLMCADGVSRGRPATRTASRPLRQSLWRRKSPSHLSQTVAPELEASPEHGHEHESEPEVVPEPTVTTVAPELEASPEHEHESEPTSEPGPEPEPTVTTVEPEPEVVAVAPISEPLTRCAAPGQPGSGRVAVLVGHAGEGIYSPVVTGGADSCAQIMVWWDALRQAEVGRIAAGQYPCEYTAAYTEGPKAQPWTNGPPYLVGCWPQYPVFLDEEPLSDPAAEAMRLETHRWTKWPPNHPAFVEAVYGCYKMALEGPPPGWQAPYENGAWPTLLSCHNRLQVFGRPMRELGIDPVCAARQYTARTETSVVRIQKFDERGAYADEFSWVNCPTAVSRLVPDPQAPFAEQCEAVVDVSAVEPSISAALPLIAGAYGLSVDDFLAEWKSIMCHSPEQEMRTATINGIDIHGDLIVGWTPPPGSVCYETVRLAVARSFIQEGTWIRVLFC